MPLTTGFGLSYGNEYIHGFNLLTALVSSSPPSELGVVRLAAAKVINGAITGGKPGHRIFYSHSDCVMIFQKREGGLLFLIAGFFLMEK